jgi:hypothetical protein
VANSQVYFVRAGADNGLIKIGYASDVPARVAQLQIGCPLSLEVLATIEGTTEDEKLFHEMFESSRERDEWFRPTSKVLAMVDQIMVWDESDPITMHTQPRVVDAPRRELTKLAKPVAGIATPAKNTVIVADAFSVGV